MRLLVFHFLLLFFVTANAQPIINADWIASPGDNFVVQRANYNQLTFPINGVMGFGLTGNNVTWDFSQLSPINAYDTIAYSGTPTAPIRKDMFGINSLSWQGDTMLLESIRTNNQCGMGLGGKGIVYHFPIGSGQPNWVYTVSSGSPSYGDYGIITGGMKYLGWGKLLLPGGIEYDSVVMIVGGADTGCVTRNGTDAATFDGAIETDSYQWISSSVKNPILTIKYWTNYYSTIDTNVADTLINVFIYQQSFLTSVSSINLNEEVRLYPNPANNELNITGQLEADEIKVFDAVGRLLMQKPFSHMLNVSQLTAGQYILQLDLREGRIIKKFGKI